jgi:hypothetical protein
VRVCVCVGGCGCECVIERENEETSVCVCVCVCVCVRERVKLHPRFKEKMLNKRSKKPNMPIPGKTQQDEERHSVFVSVGVSLRESGRGWG